MSLNRLFKCTIIGSGNWGSTIGKIVANNVRQPKHHKFDPTVRMWLYDEQIGNTMLSDIVNKTHENSKYLPGVQLPHNLIAVPDIEEACVDANLLVFVLPHQFLHQILPRIKNVMGESPVVVSLIKGIDFDDNGFVLVSDRIKEQLGRDVSVLMGANVASEIAHEKFAEATIGGKKEDHAVLSEVFQTPYFRISCVENYEAVEICGAVKNIIALGAGFCDGLDMGNNTKAAVIRIGMVELGRLIERHTGTFPVEILLESCGVADLVTTCYGGRNRKCAEEFARTNKSWEQIENELLNGQKLQGTLACDEVYRVLEREGTIDDYPLIRNIYRVAFQGANPQLLVSGLVQEEQIQEMHVDKFLNSSMVDKPRSRM